MNEDRVSAYVRLWERLKTDGVAALPNLVTPDIHFTDPFNDVHGIDGLRRMMEKTLRDLPELHFRVTHRAWDGDLCLMRWGFEAKSKGGWRFHFNGMSELTFVGDKVARHVDHWNAGRQVYEKLPVIGGVLRLIRKKIAA